MLQSSIMQLLVEPFRYTSSSMVVAAEHAHIHKPINALQSQGYSTELYHKLLSTIAPQPAIKKQPLAQNKFAIIR